MNGIQIYEAYDPRGVMQWRRLLEIRFRVVEKDEFEQLARSAGFEVAARYGDYAYADFQPDASPFMIWVLQK